MFFTQISYTLCMYVHVAILKLLQCYNIVTNHPAFCLNIPQKHSSSRYPTLAPQIPTFWVARSSSVHDLYISPLLRDKHMHVHLRIIMCCAALSPFVDTTRSNLHASNACNILRVKINTDLEC